MTCNDCFSTHRILRSWHSDLVKSTVHASYIVTFRSQIQNTSAYHQMEYMHAATALTLATGWLTAMAMATAVAEVNVRTQREAVISGPRMRGGDYRTEVCDYVRA